MLSLGILAVTGFLLVTALVVSTLLAAVLTQEGWLWFVVNECVTLAVLAGAFASPYRFVPDEVPPWKGALLGSAITSLLFETGKWALGTYLSSTTSDDAYGGAGSFVLLLLWVYYSAFIVLLGTGATRTLAGAGAAGSSRGDEASAGRLQPARAGRMLCRQGGSTACVHGQPKKKPLPEQGPFLVGWETRIRT